MNIFQLPPHRSSYPLYALNVRFENPVLFNASADALPKSNCTTISPARHGKLHEQRTSNADQSSAQRLEKRQPCTHGPFSYSALFACAAHVFPFTYQERVSASLTCSTSLLHSLVPWHINRGCFAAISFAASEDERAFSSLQRNHRSRVDAHKGTDNLTTFMKFACSLMQRRDCSAKYSCRKAVLHAHISGTPTSAE